MHGQAEYTCASARRSGFFIYYLELFYADRCGVRLHPVGSQLMHLQAADARAYSVRRVAFMHTVDA